MATLTTPTVDTACGTAAHGETHVYYLGQGKIVPTGASSVALKMQYPGIASFGVMIGPEGVKRIGTPESGRKSLTTDSTDYFPIWARREGDGPLTKQIVRLVIPGAKDPNRPVGHLVVTLKCKALYDALPCLNIQAQE